MNTKWISALKALISPSAIGIYITLTFVWICFTYYTSRDLGLQENLFIQGIRRAHEVSIDYRLLARGPVKTDTPVALLAADEKSVETIGRWPWPRSVIAQAIQQAMNDGAKVIGFDVIFSEDERNDLKESTLQLHSSGVITETLRDQMLEIADSQDGDRILSEAFENHRSFLVGGSFYQAYYDHGFSNPLEDLCQDLFFKMSDEFKQWDQEESLVSTQDPYLVQIPFELTRIYNQLLLKEIERIKSAFGPIRSSAGAVELKKKIHESLSLDCSRLFKEHAQTIESQWRQVMSAQNPPSENKFDSYADWLNHFNSTSKSSGIPHVDGWNLNTSFLSDHLSHNGFFNAQQDSDGTIRSSPLIVRTGFFLTPSMALKSYLVGTDRNASVKLIFNPATGRKEVSSFEITDNNTGEVVETVPTDGQGRLLINYAGPQKMFPHLGFSELLSDKDTLTVQETVFDKKSKRWVEKDIEVSRKEFLKDKYLLVGATATGIFDLRVTPFEKKTYPGLETHANVLSNLLSRKFLKSFEDERSKMPFFLLLLGLTHTLLLSQLGALGGIVFTASLLGGILSFDKFYLFDQGVVATVVWPLFLVISIYVVLTTYRYLTEERGKKELRETFQKYVSPSIVEEILSDPKNIELGGKKMNLTVMFSDVRGFTTISEKLDPQALTQLLNEYLTPMTDIVFKNQGTLDKYMGDAIMAFFGAPISYEKHAHFACRAALQSLDTLFLLQKEFAARGLPQIDIGIGLNSGEVSAGNMGSKTVRSYTVMGDAVNLASRLEGINKEYGTRIIISEFTYNLVKDHFTCREVDWVRVKGKTKPVKIYELMKEGSLTETSKEHFDAYNSAYSEYRKQDFISAQDYFSKALDLKPDDEVSRLFLSRCAKYVDSPPDAGWDGVFEMKTK